MIMSDWLSPNPRDITDPLVKCSPSYPFSVTQWHYEDWLSKIHQRVENKRSKAFDDEQEGS